MSDDIREKARQVAKAYYDTYCGTGFQILGTGLLKDLSQLEIKPDTINGVMDGFMDGIIDAEILYREDAPNRASPFCEMEKKLGERWDIWDGCIKQINKEYEVSTSEKERNELKEQAQRFTQLKSAKVTFNQFITSCTRSSAVWSFASGYIFQTLDKEAIEKIPGVVTVEIQNEHDRTKYGDHVINFLYKSKLIKIIVEHKVGKLYNNVVSVNISHRDKGRHLLLPSGRLYRTNCIGVGEYGILSLTYFDIYGVYKKLYCLTSNLPGFVPRGRIAIKKDREYIRNSLLIRSININLTSPLYWSDNLQEIIEACAANPASPIENPPQFVKVAKKKRKRKRKNNKKEKRSEN